MKSFLLRTLAISMMLLSMFILGAGVLYPFALAIDDNIPIWTIVPLYLLCIMIIANTKQLHNWFDKTMKD